MPHVSRHPNRVSHPSSNNKQGITSTVSLAFINGGITLPGVFPSSSSSSTQHRSIGNDPQQLGPFHTFFPMNDYNTWKGICEPSRNGFVIPWLHSLQNVQLALHIHGLSIHWFNQPQTENTQKTVLLLCCMGISCHSSHLCLQNIDIVLCIINDPRVI